MEGNKKDDEIRIIPTLIGQSEEARTPSDAPEVDKHILSFRKLLLSFLIERRLNLRHSVSRLAIASFI